MNEAEKRIAAAARNAYARKWRAANKSRVRAINENYWLRKAVKEAASTENGENRKEEENA